MCKKLKPWLRLYELAHPIASPNDRPQDLLEWVHCCEFAACMQCTRVMRKFVARKYGLATSMQLDTELLIDILRVGDIRGQDGLDSLFEAAGQKDVVVAIFKAPRVDLFRLLDKQTRHNCGFELCVLLAGSIWDYVNDLEYINNGPSNYDHEIRMPNGCSVWSTYYDRAHHRDILWKAFIRRHFLQLPSMHWTYAMWKATKNSSTYGLFNSNYLRLEDIDVTRDIGDCVKTPGLRDFMWRHNLNQEEEMKLLDRCRRGLILERILGVVHRGCWYPTTAVLTALASLDDELLRALTARTFGTQLRNPGAWQINRTAYGILINVRADQRLRTILVGGGIDWV